MEMPAGAKTGPGPHCVLLTWSDKNQSACLLSEVGRGGGKFYRRLFSDGSNFKTDLAVACSKQASLEILYFALVLSSSLAKNAEECFSSQFAMDNLGE